MERGEGDIDREFDELLGRPELAPVKALVDGLVASLLDDMAGGSAPDRRALLRKCAATVVMADSAGASRQGELTRAKADHILSLQALVETQRESIAVQTEITRKLEALVTEQEGVIADQRRLLDLLQERGGGGLSGALH